MIKKRSKRVHHRELLWKDELPLACDGPAGEGCEMDGGG